jgi:hypothetical protein
MLEPTCQPGLVRMTPQRTEAALGFFGYWFGFFTPVPWDSGRAGKV